MTPGTATGGNTTQPGCRAFRATRQEGFDAALAGEGVDACPWPKARGWTSTAIDRAFRHAWQAGWTAGSAERERRARNRRGKA